jgi:hypothetical protein
VAAVRELVIKAIGDGNDVIVAPHSWSGIVAGSALSGMGKKEREAKGEKGGVVRTAYMCSFMAPKGVGLIDALQGQIPEWWYPDVRIPPFSRMPTQLSVKTLILTLLEGHLLPHQTHGS